MKIKYREKIDYFNLLLGLCLSGNPLFTSTGYAEILFVIFAVYISLYYINSINRNFSKLLLLFGFYVVLFISQILIFNKLNLITYLGFFTRLYIGFVLFISILNFDVKYVYAIKYIIIISLPFFALNFLIPGFDKIFYPISIKYIGANDYYSIGIYSFVEDSIRNAGIFWEPGAFAGYIVLAMVFLLANKTKNPDINIKRILFLLSVGLITTMSTTGYIVFAFLLISYFSVRSNADIKYRLLTFILLPIVLFLIFKSFNRYDFLGKKIESQYKKALRHEGNWQITRFGTLLLDWKYIKKRPITGWGIHPSTRYKLNPGDEKIALLAGNGMSDFVAKTGIPSFLLFLFFIYSGFRKKYNMSWLEGAIVMTTIMLLLQGEGFLNFPMFLGLFFIPNLKKIKLLNGLLHNNR